MDENSDIDTAIDNVTTALDDLHALLSSNLSDAQRVYYENLQSKLLANLTELVTCPPHMNLAQLSYLQDCSSELIAVVPHMRAN